MISVEHLMEIQERLHNGDNLDEVFNDIYELGRADAIDEFAKLIHEDLHQLNHHQVDFLAEQLKEQKNE